MGSEICIAGRTETPEMRSQMRSGALSSQGKKGSVTRLFKSVIAKRLDSSSVRTASGRTVIINGLLNDDKMRENGFSDKVCGYFRYGIPIQWNKLVDSSMEHMDEHPESPSEPVDDALVEQYVEMLLSDNFIKHGFSFAEEYWASIASSSSAEPGTPKCCNTSAKIEGKLEENEIRTSQSGRPPSAPATGAKKRKASKNKGFGKRTAKKRKASKNKELANEALSPTADLTSHENSSSVAGISAEKTSCNHMIKEESNEGIYARLRSRR